MDIWEQSAWSWKSIRGAEYRWASSRGEARRYTATELGDGEILLSRGVHLCARTRYAAQSGYERRLRKGIAQAEAGKLNPYEPPTRARNSLNRHIAPVLGATPTPPCP